MKSLFISICTVCIAFTALAQSPAPVDETTGKVVYAGVEQVPDVSTADLYKRLDNWFNTFYVNPGSVIEEQTENVSIKGKHSLTVYYENGGKRYKKGNVQYSISIWVRDGRYKYTIDEIFLVGVPKVFIHEWLDPNAANKDTQYSYLDQVNTFVTDLLANLEKAMNTPLNQTEDDNW